MESQSGTFFEFECSKIQPLFQNRGFWGTEAKEINQNIFLLSRDSNFENHPSNSDSFSFTAKSFFSIASLRDLSWRDFNPDKDNLVKVSLAFL